MVAKREWAHRSQVDFGQHSPLFCKKRTMSAIGMADWAWFFCGFWPDPLCLPAFWQVLLEVF
eukprot:NODE_14249_length_345_cov_3.658784_g13086_i0.p1 GENE.NODE_14249_length_345_cov_3.658784_g13086_i0~~NODE_14249_length_345_cov_3.658784_g13086_i0.p1  ORF type:complete len:62 (+),score=0.04 NODE_14249_length_345_cov_3.658784_g13086_i0:157-342(+)